MLEADISTTNMAMNHQMRFNPDEDARLYVEFMNNPRLNQTKSKEAGRPIYYDAAYIRIIGAGDKSNIIHRPVRDSDKVRFPKQWQAFVNREEQVQEGTPLDEWAAISRSQAEELKFAGVRTVEALAEMPDSRGQGFMGFYAMKQKAKAFMEDAKLYAPIEGLTKENQDLRAQLEDMQRQITNMKPSANDVEDEPAPSTRRRRSKKAVDDGKIQDDKRDLQSGSD